MGPQIPMFWTSGDIFPGFQSQGGFLACVPHWLCTMDSRFTSGANPANLLAKHFNLFTYQIIMMKVGVEVTQGHIHLVCVHVLHFIFSLLCCLLHGVVFPFSLNRKKTPNMLATFDGTCFNV